MVKKLCCVLMMTLLLSGCGGGGDEAQDMALALRGEFLAAKACSGRATVTADYGQRVYQYEMEFSSDEEETCLTLLEPDTVAGLTARLSWAEGSVLEYEGLILETGPLNEDGLTPVSAIPAILREMREGYLDSYALEEGEGAPLLRLTIRDAGLSPGEGTETRLWFAENSPRLVAGELWQDGFCVIRCEFSSFFLEGTEDIG